MSVVNNEATITIYFLKIKSYLCKKYRYYLFAITYSLLPIRYSLFTK